LSKQYFSVQNIGNQIYVNEIDLVTKVRRTFKTKTGTFRYFLPGTKDVTSPFRNIRETPVVENIEHNVGVFKEKIKTFKEYGHVVYGLQNPGYQYIQEEYIKEDFDNSLVRFAFFDIETSRDDVTGYSSADEAINEIISISCVLNGRMFYWATKDLSNEFIEKNDFEFYWFNTEEEMIEHFIKWIPMHEVNVISGWNIEQYDVPYLFNRAERMDIDYRKISPFGKVFSRTFKDAFNNENTTYDIVGISILDYLNLYKKFTYVTRENYTLDNIAYVELGENKIDYSEHKDLQELYDNDFEKFTLYNLKDSRIVERLENKLKLIELAITVAYKTGVNYQDALGTVKMWEIFFYQEMMQDNLVPPMFKTSVEHVDIAGGYVKDPIKGKHKWVMSFDLASLYPHNQMGCNICFSTLIEKNELPQELHDLRESIWRKYESLENVVNALVNKEIDLSLLKKYNVSMSPNLEFYRKDKMGIAPKVLKKIYNERKEVKKQMLKVKQQKIDTGDESLENEISKLNAIQMALKILMNSEYGAMGNSYFLFNDPRNAEAITSAGRVAIQFIANKFNKFLSDIIGEEKDRCAAIDTDSTYMIFQDLVEKIFPNGAPDEKILNLLNKFAQEKIQPFIDKSYHELADYLNCYNMEWFMKREAIASASVHIAKKRYFMSVLDDEGVRMKEPKLKVTGLEAVRSSTPEICREGLKKVMKVILSKGEKETQKAITEFKKEFDKAHVLDIASPRSVSNIEKWLSNDNYIKGTPIAVKGAIIYNNMIKKKDPLEETIKSGDKIKFIALRTPNKFKCDVISLPNRIPEKLNLLDKEVNRDLQYDKTFLSAVNLILKVLGWSAEKRTKLSAFM
jgi:DNA polymerase elongation subunit (family B)